MNSSAVRSPEQVVREIWSAFDSGDVDAVLARMHRDVHCAPLTRPGRSLYVGHAGIRQMMKDLGVALGRIRVDVSSTQPDGDQVLCRGDAVSHDESGNERSVPFELSFAFLDGLVVSMESSARSDIVA